MTIENKIINCLMWMAYGDGLGFLMENTDSPETTLKNFNYSYNESLTLKKPKGQYSYVTELILITIKCLIDITAEYKVKVDYRRLIEELKLWQYYRHGDVDSIIRRIKNKDYYQSSHYWSSKSGLGISRIIPIIAANKNYHTAEMEIYRNIIWFNRHPQILFTGLLLLRSGYLLLEKSFVDKGELIDALKEYLINLRLDILNENSKGKLPDNYNVLFEKEKIQFLIELDRLKNGTLINNAPWDSRAMLLNSLNISFMLEKGNITKPDRIPHLYRKETIALGYGLWGINANKLYQRNSMLKDEKSIFEMAQYLYRLRNFQINRKYYENEKRVEDLFQLKKDDKVHHPILNMIHIKDKVETKNHIELLVKTKLGIHTFIQYKTKQ